MDFGDMFGIAGAFAEVMFDEEAAFRMTNELPTCSTDFSFDDEVDDDYMDDDF